MIKTLLWLFAKRFVAGERLEDGLAKADELRKKGFKVTLAYLGGEHLTDAGDIFNIIYMHNQLLEKLADSSYEIAVKLSQWGLFYLGSYIWKRHFLSGFKAFVKKAEKRGIFIWIDAEELKFRERTVEIISEMYYFKNLGLCVQAYAKDAVEFLNHKVLPLKIPVRICKGAYKENFKKVIENFNVNFNFASLFLGSVLFRNSIQRIQVATHDENLIGFIKPFANSDRLDLEYGVLFGRHKIPLAQDLLKKDQRINVYVPFGPEWSDFVIRRIKEKPSYIFLPFKR